MQKRKFDELISYFNRKVADMDIDTNYKMELLGMVTALGYAHEKETEDRKRGKWKVTPVYIKCSECGESFMLIPQNYCPNCGAKMEDENEAD